MHVILLAAGLSTRLDPLSDKSLLPFCGKTLIEHQVEAVLKAGFKTLTVVGNKENLSALQALFKKTRVVQVALQKNLKEGQAGGVIAAGTQEKSVLVLSSNDVFDAALFKAVRTAAQKKGIDGVIAAKKVSSYFPGGYVVANKKGFLKQVVEKPGAGNEPSTLVNLVCHLFNDFPAFLAHLKAARSSRDDRYEAALQAYIEKGPKGAPVGGARLAVLPYSGFWQPIKYPWHVLKVMSYFLAMQKPFRHKSVQMAKTAVVHGNVVLSEGVKLLDHAVVQGPAYVGKNTVIATNALVRASMVGKDCLVGFGTEIARSYLKKKVWTHSNYVGDSVIDEDVSFGAGAVVGNLRHDGKSIKMTIKGQRLDSGENKLGAVIGTGARVGVNACSHPGVKIGRRVLVGGGVLVDRDVEDDLLITQAQTLMQTRRLAPGEKRLSKKKTPHIF